MPTLQRGIYLLFVANILFGGLIYYLVRANILSSFFANILIISGS